MTKKSGNTPLALIEIEGMRFRAFHGCYPEEALVGNTFIVNLQMRADISAAAQSDNVADTLNYQEAYQIVAEQMAIRANILEHLAHRTLEALFSGLPSLQWAKLKIRKIAPAMGAFVEATSVTLERDREEDKASGK